MLCASACLIAALVNIPGEPGIPSYDNEAYYDRPVEVSHGWPFHYATRSVATSEPRAVDPWNLFEGLRRFRPVLLAADVALALGAFAVLARVGKLLRPRRGDPWQLSLAGFFLVVVLVGVPLGLIRAGLARRATETGIVLSNLDGASELSIGGPLWLERILGTRTFAWNERVVGCWIESYVPVIFDQARTQEVEKLTSLEQLNLFGFLISPETWDGLNAHPSLMEVRVCESGYRNPPTATRVFRRTRGGTRFEFYGEAP